VIHQHLHAPLPLDELEGVPQPLVVLLDELRRLRGVFLAAMGADEAQIKASFCAAIRIAKEQKSVSLEKPDTHCWDWVGSSESETDRMTPR